MTALDIKLAELCDAAADAIERLGHTRQQVQDTVTGGVCAIGAIQVACRDEHPAEWRALAGMVAEAVVQRAVQDHLGIARRFNLAWWNDMEARDMDEVVEAFRGTAMALRGQVLSRVVIPAQGVAARAVVEVVS